MSARAQSISHVRPILRRSDGAVLAWIFRLTLQEGDQSAFDDIYMDVPGFDVRPLAQWSRAFLDGALVRAATPDMAHRLLEGQRCAPCLARLLHARLDARLGAYEPTDFDLGSLAP